MKQSQLHWFHSVVLLLLLTPLLAAAQEIDCRDFENFPGLEPEGYTDRCLEGEPRPSVPPASSEAPTDTAFAHDLRNTRNTVIHPHGDLSQQSVIGLSTSIIFGYDYNPDLSVLYGINWGTGQLGTSDGITFTPIGLPFRPEGHTWSGLAIDPVSGEAYLSSTDSSVSTLQTVDLASGNSTIIGNMGDLPLVIEIAINCEGVMYAHDIGNDAIYTIDRKTGQPTLVGPHGLKTNFAQGMDFDNASGDLYIYAYTGGGSVTYGRVNLNDGSIFPLNINDPEGEWEGASRTVCPPTGPARFRVDKDFDDDNAMDVEVSIECNTGLPLSQTAHIGQDTGVTFVVNDFAGQELDCEITEAVPDGYQAEYFNGEQSSDTACEFVNIEPGSERQCLINNRLEPVKVTVGKEWIDENPEERARYLAEAVWSCTNVAQVCYQPGLGSCASGRLEFRGNPASDEFSIFPDWQTGTLCAVSELMSTDGNTETDDSDCASIILFPGAPARCTIYNTRLFAGIPTIDAKGLLILFLLLCGCGAFAVRQST